MQPFGSSDFSSLVNRSAAKSTWFRGGKTFLGKVDARDVRDVREGGRERVRERFPHAGTSSSSSTSPSSSSSSAHTHSLSGDRGRDVDLSGERGERERVDMRGVIKGKINMERKEDNDNDNDKDEDYDNDKSKRENEGHYSDRGKGDKGDKEDKGDEGGNEGEGLQGAVISPNHAEV